MHYVGLFKLRLEKLSSLRSELFNINLRLQSKEDSFISHNRISDYVENAAPTRPSTNGFMKAELEPIDHEKSIMKLKVLLQRQLKNAKGKRKLEIERRLAEIDHPKIKIQNNSAVIPTSEYLKVFSSHNFRIYGQ
jgi:ribonucleotide reductase alpha subunit